jgi:hypothetical protein
MMNGYCVNQADDGTRVYYAVIDGSRYQINETPELRALEPGSYDADLKRVSDQ